MLIRTVVASTAILMVSTGAALAESGDPLAKAWVGKHSDELMKSWGEPTKIKSKSNGTQVFVYKLVYDHGLRLVNGAGWYFGQDGIPRTPSSPRYVDPYESPATTTPGPAGIKKTGKKKRTYKFFIDDDGHVYDTRSKPKQ